MRRLRALITGLLVCVTALAVVIGFAAPALAAYVCPLCYGFERAEDDLWLERGHEGHAIIDAYHGARGRVEAGFDGTALPDATILVCHTEACDRRIGLRGARGQAYGARFLVLASTGDETIPTHELAHIVMHDEAGSIGLLRGDLPSWRDEGIAVLVSRDDRYFDFDAVPPACKVEPDAPLPTTPGAWSKAMRPDTHLILYAQAACAVFRESGLPPYDPATFLQGNG